MKRVSLLEFRKNAETIIRWSQQGKRMIMTYRGRPVIRLEPIREEPAGEDDPLLKLEGIATGKKEKLQNREIDEIIYGG